MADAESSAGKMIWRLSSTSDSLGQNTARSENEPDIEQPMYFAPLMENVRLLPTVALIGLLILSTTTGCRKANDPAQWDVDLMAPVLTTRLTLSHLIPDSFQSIGANGEVTLVYRSELFAVDLDSLLGLPDTNFVYPYALPLAGNDQFTLAAGFPVISENNLIRFELPQVELTRLDIREGTLAIDMRNKIASRILGNFELPTASFPDGLSTISTSVEAGTAAVPSQATVHRDLAGVRLDLRGPGLNLTNTLATNLSASLDPAGSGATVTNQDSIVIKASYHDLVPSYAKGYFGSNELSYPDQRTRLGLFDRFVGGSLDLDQVTLRLNVENGLGVDLRVQLDGFHAVNTRTGSTVDMTHAMLEGPINLNRALDYGNGFTPSRYDNVLDNTNSNVDAFLEVMPDEVRYGLDISLNPLGDISNGNDFLYYESKLRAGLELEVPLHVIATGLTLESVDKPDLPGDADHRSIVRGTLHLFADNGFPFAATVMLDIVNTDHNVLSTIPVEGVVLPGVMGPTGVVGSPTHSTLHAALTEDQVGLLYGEGRIRTRVVFDTDAGLGHVRILDGYALDLQLTVDGTYIVNGQ